MRRIFWPLAAFPVAFGAASLLGGYPWQLAMLTALAIAALVYSTEGALRRLVVLFQHDEVGPLTGSRLRPVTPGEERKANAQQEVHSGSGSRSPEEEAEPGSEEPTGNEKSTGG